MGLPLQECQNKTTSTEYLKWLIYLDKMELERFDRHECYMAQIALEVRRSYSKKKWKLKDFFIKFASTKVNQIEAESEESIAERKAVLAEQSRNSWFASLGIKKKDL